MKRTSSVDESRKEPQSHRTVKKRRGPKLHDVFDTSADLKFIHIADTDIYPTLAGPDGIISEGSTDPSGRITPVSSLFDTETRLSSGITSPGSISPAYETGRVEADFCTSLPATFADRLWMTSCQSTPPFANLSMDDVDPVLRTHTPVLEPKEDMAAEPLQYRKDTTQPNVTPATADLDGTMVDSPPHIPGSAPEVTKAGQSVVAQSRHELS